MIRLTLVMSLCLSTSGCSWLGTVFIGKHPDSLVENDDYSQVKFCKVDDADGKVDCADEARLALVPALVAAQAIPLLVGAVQKGIEAESKRYRSTYSARGAHALFTCAGPDTTTTARSEAKTESGGVTTTTTSTKTRIERTVAQDFDVLRFERRYGDADQAAIQIDFDVGIDDRAQFVSLSVRHFTIRKTRSKVWWGSFWPTHWLATLIWAPWWALDRDVGKVDFNAQVEVTAVVAGKTHPVGTVDFPLEPVAIHELAVEKGGERIPASGFLPLPVFACDDAVVLPINVRVTVMEANDLGDVLAAAAKKMKE